MKTFKLNIATPDGRIFSDEVEMLIARGNDGEFAILAGHIPFVTTLIRSECKIDLPNDITKKGKIDGGILSVTKTETTLLSGSFEWVE